ncbi:drug transporter [Clavulina sp. PMI_390]|nr:drug transporter [Clavulina sp. PMI_390]
MDDSGSNKSTLERPKSDDSEFIVDWAENDSGNPFHWSKTRKWTVTISVSTISGFSAAASSIIAIGFPSMQNDLKCTEFQATLSLALYPLGFALTPLILAPLSEEWGRRPIYLASSFLFTMLFLPIALATDIHAVMGLRFLQGAAASTGSAMVGGTLADIWTTEERGNPMSLFSFAVLGVCGIAPAISGAVETSLGWRWIQWIGMIASGVFLVFLVLYGAPETRGTILLAHRAKQLREKTGDLRYRTPYPPPNLRQLIWLSTTRSIYFLFTEPIVTSFSLWIGFAWGLVYVLLDSIGIVFKELYGFNSWQIGLVFLTLTVGTAIGLALNPYQEHLYRKNYARIGPEARLYSACAAGVTFSLGSFLYAWTSYPFVPWIAPCIGIVIIIASVFAIYQAVFNYMADCNVMGMAFPLFTRQLYKTLTFRWGAVLAPIPFILFWFGPNIRARSKFASGIVSSKAVRDNEAELAGNKLIVEKLADEAKV